MLTKESNNLVNYIGKKVKHKGLEKSERKLFDFLKK